MPAMNSIFRLNEVTTHLGVVAEALDNNRKLEIFPGGLVLPSEGASEHIRTLGYEEFINEQQTAGTSTAPGTTGSATESWQRTTTCDSTGETGPGAPQLIESRIGSMSPNDLAQVRATYPQLGIRTACPGIWLTGNLTPLGPRGYTASLALAYPAALDVPVRAWAWWDVGIAVGPRHTNADASICAYEPTDESWREEYGITLLLDFISVWLVRHALLATHGVWFGQQRVHTAIERIVWQSAGEFCGCGQGRRYENCHSRSDTSKTDRELVQEIVAVAPQLRGRPISSIRDAITARRYPRNWDELYRAASQPSPRIRNAKA